MTYTSLQVLNYPETLNAIGLDSYKLKSNTFQCLEKYKTSPDHLAAWARRHDLPIYYIDNCWIRVPVAGKDLRAYYRYIVDDESHLSELEQRIVESANYLIEAEEF